MKKGTNKLTLEDFARLFGTKTGDLPKDCLDLISKNDFSYKILDKDESDATILTILKKIESGELSVAGKEDEKRWEKYWGKVFDNLVETDYNLKKLIPEYIKHVQLVRFDRKFILPENKMFWTNWINIFKCWFFGKYLKDVDSIHEFGCGTGQNLVKLAKIFPDKKLYGYDWVKPSVNIVNSLAKKHSLNLKGKQFDMFAPDESLSFEPNSAVLTVHALEQIGANFEKFLDFVVGKSPALCINIEPICELWDEENLVDYLAVKFHEKRNYLRGYLNYLHKLEKEGKIEILKVQRVPFGNLFHEAYSYIIWRPKIKIKNKTKK
jgi:hypothetical protein